ncbi:MAG: isoprenyl transferase [Micavibrio aeruginosavorus]|uniref:Isoprenyl transferase n=1 Tax=Micavibrio aeruginosavorus TaxID=349221 RepID=A0A2W5MUK8_9BACT|nr:MAG: isoprenyl transferase [Micavibrio aeruginosavorus]
MQKQIPQHIAIIMDGNGRWAKSRGLPRTAGHHQGVEACKRTVRAAGDLGIKYITLFSFSSENWSRPAEEITELMRLLRMFLRSETADLHRNNVRLRVIGSRKELSADIVELIENAENLTKDNDALFLNIALNYGSRNEILEAAASYAKQMAEQGIAPDFASAEEYFPQHLMTKGIPDPDILIRTSGEQRISNFLLWQCAYTELVFTSTLWPDFSKSDLESAIADFQKRERRFGAITN